MDEQSGGARTASENRPPISDRGWRRLVTTVVRGASPAAITLQSDEKPQDPTGSHRKLARKQAANSQETSPQAKNLRPFRSSPSPSLPPTAPPKHRPIEEPYAYYHAPCRICTYLQQQSQSSGHKMHHSGTRRLICTWWLLDCATHHPDLLLRGRCAIASSPSPSTTSR